MVTIFDKQITPDTVKELIDLIEKTEDVEVIIYISSEGGYVYSCRILTDYLSNKATEKNISVIASGYIDSCAFEMLVDLNSNIYTRVAVLEGTTATVHKYSVSLDTRKLEQMNSAANAKHKSMERVNFDLANKLKLNHEQLTNFFSGENVYLDTPDITNILKQL